MYYVFCNNFSRICSSISILWTNEYFCSKYMTIHIVSLDFIFNHWVTHTHTRLVFRTIWIRRNSCELSTPTRWVLAQFHKQEDWGADIKHWPAVTQLASSVVRTGSQAGAPGVHAFNHDAVLPLSALNGASSTEYTSFLLFTAFTACAVEQYSCKCPSTSTEDYFSPIFLHEDMEELLNDTRLLKS